MLGKKCIERDSVFRFYVIFSDRTIIKSAVGIRYGGRKNREAAVCGTVVEV